MHDQEKWQMFTFENLEQPNFGILAGKIIGADKFSVDQLIVAALLISVNNTALPISQTGYNVDMY